MRLVLETEQRVRLTADETAFAIDDEGGGLSPFHFLAASLAACTYSVLAGWAEHADLDTTGLEIAVDWEFGGDPYQVSSMDMQLTWPGLPPERHDAARRAATQCTVHATLERGTHVETRVSG
jgi:uncharacterized OsmC-like protein